MAVTTHIDPVLGPLLIDASIQAYNAYDSANPGVCARGGVTPPQGYGLVGCFTGVDAVLGAGFPECFGVVFRSNSAPYTYVFAFRGTYTMLDALEDAAFWEWTTFVPIGGKPPSMDGKVADGFWSIYTDTVRDKPSMQQQVFALLDQYQGSAEPVSQLLITGHSLGGALSTLFALDVALSPHAAIPSTHINYASPQVGDPPFAALYDGQIANTVRVQNTYDIVPCGPSELLGYQHVGEAFLLAFYTNSWIDPFGKYHDHQALNYQAVLNCAVRSSEQVCLDNSLSVPTDNETLTSIKPDPSTLCTWW